MTRTLQKLLIFGVLSTMLFTACVTTTLTSTWKDPSYQGHPGKVMVIGIARKPLNKRIFEDEFVRQLKARGINAVASYTVMPDEKQADHAVIAEKVKEQGADTVLISRLASKKTVHTYVPGSVTHPPTYYNAWRDYYGYGYQVVYTPGYTAEDEYAVMESNLYDAVNGKLIWSASSETEIRGSNQTQIISYIDVMVNAMADQKLLRQE
jgi:hypothetical protein